MIVKITNLNNMHPIFNPSEKTLSSKQAPSSVLEQLGRHISEHTRGWNKWSNTPFLGEVDPMTGTFRFRVTSMEGSRNGVPVWAEGKVVSSGQGSSIRYKLGLRKFGKIMLMIALTIMALGVAFGVIMSTGIADFGVVGGVSLIGFGTIVVSLISVFAMRWKFNRESDMLETYLYNSC